MSKAGKTFPLLAMILASDLKTFYVFRLNGISCNREGIFLLLQISCLRILTNVNPSQARSFPVTWNALIWFFFLQAPGALGSYVRFWTPTLTGLNADEAAWEVSERAILRFTHTTHARGLSTQVRDGGSNPRRQPPILGSCQLSAAPPTSYIFFTCSYVI